MSLIGGNNVHSSVKAILVIVGFNRRVYTFKPCRQSFRTNIHITESENNIQPRRLYKVRSCN